MANHTGNDGTVKVSTNTVAEVRSFELSISNDTAEDTVMGDTWKTFIAMQAEWDASLEVFWDETDTAQTALIQGATVALSLGFEGHTTGDTIYTGNAIVTGLTIKGTHNGVVEASIKAKGNGTLTKTTA